jgi:hypothetical protein
MHRRDGRQEIDRRTLLARGAPHLRRFSSQAAPGKNRGDFNPASRETKQERMPT